MITMTGGIEMDWITGLQKAIDYIEGNITEKIDYEEIARLSYSSSFNFQRTFSILTGITLGEYIRNRRLTLAGTELSMSKAKIIDIALKYGYDTPESFTKAFSRFHGITPKAARESGASLKSFSRMSIKIIMKGGDIMDYKIEKKEAFKIAAKVRSFPADDSISKVEIPKFWSEFMRDGSMDVICRLGKTQSYVTGKGLLGICDGDSCGESSKCFNYSIGIETDADKVPEGYSILEVPACTWAVFICKGPMPKAIQDMWKRIYSEFFPQSDYEPAAGIDFELYPEGDNSKADYISEIWLPVRKKA